MREKSSMIEKTIALIAFFTSLFIFGQIRFFLKLRRKIRNSENIPGIFYLSDMLGLCCATGECLVEGAAQEGKRHEPPTEQKPLSKEFQKWQPKEETIEYGHFSEEEERELVEDILKGSPRTSLGWVTNTLKIRTGRVVEIIALLPDFIIEDNTIIDLRSLSEAELEERKIKD